MPDVLDDLSRAIIVLAARAHDAAEKPLDVARHRQELRASLAAALACLDQLDRLAFGGASSPEHS